MATLTKSDPITQTTTATEKNGIFNHFGIRKSMASIWGCKPEEVIEVEISVSENQAKPGDQKKGEPDYWGFWNYERNEWSLIYPSWVLLLVARPRPIKKEF